jgi:hypothetical protein
MEIHQILLLTAVLGTVVADIAIRLRMGNGRRDDQVNALLTVLDPAEDEPAGETMNSYADSLTESLLRYFQQSFVSRQVVSALACSPRGMTEKQLEQRFAELASRAGKRTVPSNALRKVIMILMGADFVRISEGRFKITEYGSALHSSLQSGRDGGSSVSS